MKVGIIPINVGVADPGWIIALSQKAEEVGLESVWTFEHVIVPVDYESKYPYSPNNKMGATPETPFIDPLIAHQRRELGRGHAGHEKHDCRYVLSRRPTYILIYPTFTPQPLRQTALDEAVWGDFARELLREPGLWEQYELRALRTERAGSRCFNLLVRRD